MARITVVDDYPDFLSAMYAILDGIEGHAVAAFTGADTTVDELVRTRPDLLILDLHVAEGQDAGLSIGTLVQADPSLRHVPIIICSGDMQGLRTRATKLREHGVYTLAKPFDMADLTALVNRALTGGPDPVHASAQAD